MEVEFDPKKADANLKKHEISFEEATSCLLDPIALVRDDPDARGEVRLVLVGLSSKERLLTLCYTLRGEDTIRLISARKATAKERNNYAQGI